MYMTLFDIKENDFEQVVKSAKKRGKRGHSCCHFSAFVV